jgi:aspartyl-tRNA(Asn)/glutamyl-tRNA(Gln) amidotransferase subunit C
MGKRVSIGRDEVLHVARLAELAVAEGDLDRLVEQLNRIVDYVASLDEVSSDAAAESFLAGPQSVVLREDVERSGVLSRPPASIAPEFAEGFFLVPRHGAMEDQ